METVRQLLHEAVPGVTENYKWGRPVFSAGKDVAYLKAAKTHISLGFFQAYKLQDNTHLLEGTGKDMRHIKIRKAADIDKALLTGWFKTVAA